MALSGVSGPFKGAYFTQVIEASTPTTTGARTALEFWQWTVPAGMDIAITNVQAYATVEGTPAARVDLEDDGTSVLTTDITLVATTAIVGTLSTATGVLVAGASVLTADWEWDGTTTVPTGVKVMITGYVRDHPNSVRRGSDYRGSGYNEGV